VHSAFAPLHFCHPKTQAVTAMMFVPGSGDTAVLVFRGSASKDGHSTVWAFSILGEVLMSGVKCAFQNAEAGGGEASKASKAGTGFVVQGCAVTQVVVPEQEAADGGGGSANPLGAGGPDLSFMREPNRLVEIEYDEML
jgi:hypothetical protein